MRPIEPVPPAVPTWLRVGSLVNYGTDPKRQHGIVKEVVEPFGVMIVVVKWPMFTDTELITGNLLPDKS